MSGTLRFALLLATAIAALLASCGPRDAQSPDALVGHWEGNVAYRDATLPVDLDIEIRGGRLAARATVPALMLRDLPLEAFAFESPRLRFRLPMGRETWAFDGWFRRNIVSGTFSGGSLPTTSNRGRLPQLGLRRVTRRADPYTTDTVSFAAGAARLAGTVHAPADSVPHPAVVLLPDADGETRVSRRELADRFARAGFAVLAYDPRGRDASGGTPVASLAELEADAAAAVEFLRSRAGVDPGRVGLHGRWLSGLLVPSVAARARTAFAIAISPPSATWSATQAPTLVLYGARDDLMPAVERTAQVRAALATSGNANVRVEVVPRADHALMLRPSPGEPFDFPRASPGGIDTLLAWARRQAGLPPIAPPLVPPAR